MKVNGHHKIVLFWAALLIGACSQGPRETAPEDLGQSPAVDDLGAEETWTPDSGFPLMDVTEASGVDFVHFNGAEGRRLYVETMSPGVTLFDADGDGDLDLYLVNGAPLPGSTSVEAPRNGLFFNRGDGSFEEGTESSGTGDTGYGNGSAAGDYDGDGDLDLYVLNYGPNVLYRNDGRGRFEPITVGAEDPSWSIAAAFLDYDEDGDLDLYVVNYLEYDVRVEKACKAGELEIYCSPEGYPPAADRLYENREGLFVDVSREVGLRADGRGMGIAVSDLDDDGDQDIYIANDRSENHLYRNDGGSFTEVAAESGVGFGMTGQTEGGMGAIIADFTGTGRMAIFHTNFQREPNRFYLDSGDGFFDDRSFPSGLGLPSLEMVSWGIAAFDVEGDGDLDLAVANGHVWDNAAEFIPGSSYAMKDQLFLNDGEGGFEALEFPGTPLSSRGIASGDLDGDGDPDLVIASCGGRARIWRNDGGRPKRFLVLQLIGRAPNTDAYGSRVIATVGSRLLRHDVTDGGSYASHSDSRLYLGLGEQAQVNHIEIRWPDGTVETATDVGGGRRLVWRQGEGIVLRQRLEGTAR